MIKPAKMFKTTRGHPYDTWEECAINEAADQFRVFLPDAPGRDEHALEIARLFIAHDKDVCNAWGLLYRIAETEPGKEPLEAAEVAERFKPAPARKTWFPKLVGERA